MTGRWFSSGTPVSSTNETDRHDITELLLKVVLYTMTLTLLDFVNYHMLINKIVLCFFFCFFFYKYGTGIYERLRGIMSLSIYDLMFI